MKIMVVGASKGLGKAFIESLGESGDTLIGVSRSHPGQLPDRPGIEVRWLEVDLNQPADAVPRIEQALATGGLDTLIYNLGIWEPNAFEPGYAFAQDRDDDLQAIINCNIAAPILLIKRLLPALLNSTRPRIILIGSTSGLPRSGRPEVTFGASKFALHGMADALRESYRQQHLGVTCLNLGYLNTEQGLQIPREQAAEDGEGHLIPLHDVIQIVSTLLKLSPASFVRELTLPAILDERF